ncbi:uncharacterized protein VTP21DRAFT_11277 [Calcarisporiella thermophila]|uniref:uncharacterized protein n=1 Tax=Calcarisporiella thermophila TaxID=911321 RepID=UPI0037431E5F
MAAHSLTHQPHHLQQPIPSPYASRAPPWHKSHPDSSIIRAPTTVPEMSPISNGDLPQSIAPTSDRNKAKELPPLPADVAGIRSKSVPEIHQREGQAKRRYRMKEKHTDSDLNTNGGGQTMLSGFAKRMFKTKMFFRKLGKTNDGETITQWTEEPKNSISGDETCPPSTPKSTSFFNPLPRHIQNPLRSSITRSRSGTLEKQIDNENDSELDDEQKHLQRTLLDYANIYAKLQMDVENKRRSLRLMAAVDELQSQQQPSSPQKHRTQLIRATSLSTENDSPAIRSWNSRRIAMEPSLQLPTPPLECRGVDRRQEPLRALSSVSDPGSDRTENIHTRIDAVEMSKQEKRLTQILHKPELPLLPFDTSQQSDSLSTAMLLDIGEKSPEPEKGAASSFFEKPGTPMLSRSRSVSSSLNLERPNPDRENARRSCAPSFWVEDKETRGSSGKGKAEENIEENVEENVLSEKIEEETTNLDSKEGETEEDEVSQIARRCYEEDETFLKKEDIAEFLGKNEELNTLVLSCYMSYFNFSELRLDDALRSLCARLYLKGETQKVDRILEAFAKRYFECNSSTIFGSADIVHAVAYSLLLLNTDLHIAELSNRMTRSEFVKNTLSTVRMHLPNERVNGDSPTRTGTNSRPRRSQSIKKTIIPPLSNQLSDIESVLKEMYSAIRTNQILQPTGCNSEPPVRPSRQSMLLLGGSMHPGGFTSAVSLNRSRSTLNRPSTRDSRDGASPRLHDKKDSLHYQVVHKSESMHTLNHPSNPFSPNRRFAHSSISLSTFAGKSGDFEFDDQMSITSGASNASTLHSPIPSATPLCVPYMKQGVLLRKHLLEKKDHKARQRDWKEFFVVVDRGSLRMFQTDAKKVTPVHRNGERHPPWMAGAVLAGRISLRHTLAKTLPPPGYSRARPHVFALTISNGGIYLFQAPNAQQVTEWVSTCNYQAARESRPPLSGGVSNIEYGWSRCLKSGGEEDGDEFKAEQSGNGYVVDRPINEWQPPAPPMVSSNLDEASQIQALNRHVEGLERELENHSEYREAMEQLYPPKSPQLLKATSNWERKSQYLLAELVRYQEYLECLAAARAQSEQQEKEAMVEAIIGDGITEPAVVELEARAS